MQVEASGLQRFAEGLEDRLRKKALSPHTLREAFQLIAAADRVLSSVSSAGREILNELGARPEEEGRAPQGRIASRPNTTTSRAPVPAPDTGASPSPKPSTPGGGTGIPDGGKTP
jgi:hypothetical protein